MTDRGNPTLITTVGKSGPGSHCDERVIPYSRQFQSWMKFSVVPRIQFLRWGILVRCILGSTNKSAHSLTEFTACCATLLKTLTH